MIIYTSVRHQSKTQVWCCSGGINFQSCENNLILNDVKIMDQGIIKRKGN